MNFYVGQRVKWYCWECGNEFRTQISSPSGSLKNHYCRACQRAKKVQRSEVEEA
jgi:hypothetical protein